MLPQDMPDGETQGLIARYGGIVAAVIGSGIAAVMGWLFHRVIDQHDGEIKAIKKKLDHNSGKLEDVATKDDLDTLRKETREADIALHQKVENIFNAVHSKIDSAVAQGTAQHNDVMKILLEQRSRRRHTDKD